MKRQKKSSSSISPQSSFSDNGLYCPAGNNPDHLSFPASLFLHHKYGYYVTLRSPLRHDVNKKLFHYLKSGDVFSYSGGFIKIVDTSVVEIYDLFVSDPIATIYYKSKRKR